MRAMTLRTSLLVVVGLLLLPASAIPRGEEVKTSQCVELNARTNFFFLEIRNRTMGDFKSSLVQDDWQGGVRDGAGKGLVDNLDNGGCDGFKLDRRQVYGEPTVWETLVDVFGNNPSGYARIWYRPDNRSYDLAFTMNTNDSTCVTNAISAAEAQNVTCVPAKSINGRGEEPESVAIRPVVWDNNQ